MQLKVSLPLALIRCRQNVHWSVSTEQLQLESICCELQSRLVHKRICLSDCLKSIECFDAALVMHSVM